MPGPMIPLYKPCVPAGLGETIGAILASGQIAAGPAVAQFETALGAYLGNPLTTLTGDVSTSLTIALFLSGVKPGDEVLMSPLVCLATSCPVKNLFADIRWCDVDPMTGNLDPTGLAAKITPRTRAIVVYHWAGNPAELEPIQALARSRGLAVIEDAGEALGAEYHGRKIGATGSDYTVFSFYPNRHLTTIEGGAIACAREDDFDRARWTKRYGMHLPTFRDPDGEINPASDVRVPGWNSYLNQIGATVGLAQLEKYPDTIARYQDNGLWYDRTLAGVPGIKVLQRPADSRSVYWVYTLLAEDRDGLLKRLRRHGVYASKVHLRNDLYSGLGGSQGPLPGADHFAARCLSIPCGWWVTDEDRARIAEIVSREAL